MNWRALHIIGAIGSMWCVDHSAGRMVYFNMAFVVANFMYALAAE